MAEQRDILQMDTSPVVTTFEKNSGYFVTKKLTVILCVLSIATVLATGLLVYYFSACDGQNPTLNRHTGSGSIENDNLIQINDIINSRKDLSNEVTGEEEDDHETRKYVRLPRSVVPDSYEIKLIPFIWENNFTFHGEVRIRVKVLEPTRNITLHINDLDIDESLVVVRPAASSHGNDIHNDKLTIERFTNDTDRQFFVTHLRAFLMEGAQYDISMKFVGQLNDILQGFYRSSYTIGKTTRWIATTQFQPTDARRAFPCFDEPALKAKFTIHIGRPANMTSISNMPQQTSGRPVAGISNYVWDEYKQSVPMSTYLVAFVVSDFEHKSDSRFSVWARSEAISQAQYSLEIGPKILSHFEKYFDIDFPLPKVDMMALPDFAAGAMENWGLVTYRETAMLYEHGVSNSNNKQRVATVVSHELAHQWFGNLVTPTWWSDLWLNEGFASYVEYIGVDAVEPSWKILDQFVVQEVQNVFALDALQTSHPISVEVHHPDEINEIFDRISYGKGASLIRMMDHFLTTAVFKRGLSRYLKRHEYGNAEQDHLWGALTEQAHEDQVLNAQVTVKTIMDTWTLQTGFPVVTVTRNYFTKTATLSQERFLLYKPANSTSNSADDRPLWWIPITYTTSMVLDFTTTHPSHWMQAQPTLTLKDLPSDKSWLILNILQTGFYRVNYDAKNWQLIIQHLKNPQRFEDISSANRAQLIDDALNLARSGLLDYETAMNVTSYLKDELDYLPWKSAFTGFSYLDAMLVKTGSYDKFKTYVLKLIEKLYNHVGFKDSPGDPQLIIYKRMHVLSWACAMGHPDCIHNSVLQFQNWRSSPDPDKTNPISPNLKSVVYCTAIRVGGQDEWDFAWERYKNSNVGSEKELLLQALGCSREVWILSRLLDWSLTENTGIRKQDVARVFGSVANNVVGQILSFNLLREQWPRLRNYLGVSLFTVSNIVRTSTKRVNTKFELHDLIEFAKVNRHELGTASRVVDQSIEQAAANIQWMDQNYQPIVRWLTEAVR